MRKLPPLLLILLLLGGCGGVPGTVTFEARRASYEPADGYAERILPGGQKIWVAADAVLTAADVAAAEVIPGPRGPMVSVILDEAGRLKFSSATAAQVGKPMALIIDGDLVSAPLVRAPITGNRLLITGHFDDGEARRIAEGIAPAAP